MMTIDVASLRHSSNRPAVFRSENSLYSTHASAIRIAQRQERHQLGDAPREKWYRDIGGGMGQALNAASSMEASTLSDRGTWLSFKNKGTLVVAIEGDPRLINRYDVIELSPQKHASSILDTAKVFADWLVSSEGVAGHRGLSGERAKFVQSFRRLA
jgi:tungstate transport system substrate-binding protein